MPPIFNQRNDLRAWGVSNFMMETFIREAHSSLNSHSPWPRWKQASRRPVWQLFGYIVIFSLERKKEIHTARAGLQITYHRKLLVTISFVCRCRRCIVPKWWMNKERTRIMLSLILAIAVKSLELKERLKLMNFTYQSRGMPAISRAEWLKGPFNSTLYSSNSSAVYTERQNNVLALPQWLWRESEYIDINGMSTRPLKANSGSRPIFWQTLTNQWTPTATCATSSSAILATMFDVRRSPKPTNLCTSRGPASSPLASCATRKRKKCECPCFNCKLSR